MNDKTKGTEKTAHAEKSQTAEQPSTAGTRATPRLVKKISALTVCGKLEPPTKARRIFTIIGVANGVKTGTSTYGEYCGFTGTFEATNAETGEVFHAGTAFVPDVVTDMLHSALAEAQKSDATASVRFALDVGITPDAKSKTGYQYTVKPLVNLAANDALADLRATLPALAAPTK